MYRICTVNTQLSAGTSEDDAYSHLSQLLWDDSQQLRNRSWAYGGKGE